MKDMGQLHYCLGVNIVYGQNCVWLHQKHYITLMLRKFGLAYANTVSTPANCNVKLVKDDHVGKSTDQVEYQSMVGSLLYIAMGTRPDITQAVGVVSKFCSNPTEAHKTAVKRIFRYLKKTINLVLKYCKDEKTVTGFSDADWGDDLDDRHLTTGNVFLLAGGAVSWLSKKQAVVALSTSEAEYVTLSLAAQEATWLQKLLADLQIPTKLIVTQEDNQGAIALARNPIARSRTKHINSIFISYGKHRKKVILILGIVPHLRWSLIYLLSPLPVVSLRNCVL